jgi:hypothetical protein
MTDLRKLMDHLTYIERGGKLIRELDIRTGRIVSRPVTEDDIGSKTWPSSDAQIRAFQRANPPLEVDGLIGKKTLAVLTQRGYKPPAGFAPVADKANAGGSNASRDLGSNAAGAVSNDSAATSHPGGYPGQLDKAGGPTSADERAARAPDGGYYSDSAFVKKINARAALKANTNGNRGHGDSKIGFDADPEDPSTWPPGVKPAPDNIGYLDPNDKWIPTPFHERNEDGRWDIPKNSPANRYGIAHNQLTQFQQKVEKLDYKNNLSGASAIEQSKSIQLPNGAPKIPGFTQVDANQFSKGH